MVNNETRPVPYIFTACIDHSLFTIHYLCPMQFSSSLLENAVNEFAKLPGIGKKTALRLVLHLLKQNTADVNNFSEVIARMRSEIKFCQRCFNVADADICSICANSMRKQEIICVVENIRDVIAIESTQQYNGTYHVLGGVISPLDGIGPDQLNIESLINRIRKEKTEELIFALNPTIQGDTTIYYIQKKLQPVNLRITTIARGIAFGGELEYADEMTLARSLQNRLPVESYVANK
ncbi:MAG TPA: recombination mediator RecR [Chitinophagaceae bacterium]|nr:recombination mediator RecR [Chitinophagaceae bacterium]